MTQEIPSDFHSSPLSFSLRCSQMQTVVHPVGQDLASWVSCYLAITSSFFIHVSHHAIQIQALVGVGFREVWILQRITNAMESKECVRERLQLYPKQ